MQVKRLKKLWIFLIPLTFILSQCFNTREKPDPRGAQYAGAEACVSCHKDISASFHLTAHFMASLPASDESIQGSFSDGQNELIYNPVLKVRMERRDSGFFQTAIEDGRPQRSERFDIVFGGVKGQSYAYWHNHKLFELPVSVDGDQHKWMSSPGYSSTEVFYDRLIGTRCLDCHASYIKPLRFATASPLFKSEKFNENTLVYSVDCERCHGPGAAHVKFQKEHPDVKTAKYIIPISSLSRDEKINMCAICHSGAGAKMFQPSFGYKPADSLSKFMSIPPTQVDFQHIDVHGNQLELLKTSKCFVSSNLDCNTCHNSHVADRDKPEIYAQKCITCHSTSHNPFKLSGRVSALALTNNCVSCHMPALPSKAIVMNHSGVTVHTHHIAIYPDQTQKILAMINHTHQ